MERRTWRATLTVAAAVMMLVLCTHALQRLHRVRAERAPTAAQGAAGEAFLYRFDAAGEAYVYTFTLPVGDASPHDVVTVSGDGHLDVWVTESGADRIGRLTFTDTTDYRYEGFPLPPGSKPLNLLAAQGAIWFTAARGDYLGRLDPATGHVDAFEVGVGTYPADLVVGPNGNIWFTQMMADQLAELVVTSTVDYAVNVYADTFLSQGRPYGIAVTRGSIYLAQTANDLVSVFTPPGSWLHMPLSGFPETLDEPYGLAVDNQGLVWGTERAGDAVTSFNVGTFPIIARRKVSPPGGQPTGIAVDPNNEIWFTQRAAGQIGRLNPRLPAGQRLSYYPLPQPGLAPTGIAADGHGHIWVVAARSYRLSLPLVLRGAAR